MAYSLQEESEITIDEFMGNAFSLKKSLRLWTVCSNTARKIMETTAKKQIKGRFLKIQAQMTLVTCLLMSLTSIGDLNDDVKFSIDGSDYSYNPWDDFDPDGFNSPVTHIRDQFQSKGGMR